MPHTPARANRTSHQHGDCSPELQQGGLGLSPSRVASWSILSELLTPPAPRAAPGRMPPPSRSDDDRHCSPAGQFLSSPSMSWPVPDSWRTPPSWPRTAAESEVHDAGARQLLRESISTLIVPRRWAPNRVCVPENGWSDAESDLSEVPSPALVRARVRGSAEPGDACYGRSSSPDPAEFIAVQIFEDDFVPSAPPSSPEIEDDADEPRGSQSSKRGKDEGSKDDDMEFGDRCFRSPAVDRSEKDVSPSLTRQLKRCRLT